MNLEIDLALDSLARAETFAALEQAFQTEFSGDEAASALTVRSVVELIDAKAGKDAEISSVDLNWGKIVRESDAAELPEIQHILKDQTAFSAVAFVVYKFFNLMFRVLLNLEVKGLENLEVKDARAFLICPNHQSFLDPFVLCSNYRFDLFKRIFHVGASEFFDSSLTAFIAKLLNVVPVNPDTELMRAMKAGAIGLKNGRVLNIYPEGERAFDGELHAFKKGAAILAAELDLPIVPVAIDGTYKVWPRNSRKIRLSKVKVSIGKPFYAREILGENAEITDESYGIVTEHLKTTIASMIEEMRKA